MIARDIMTTKVCTIRPEASAKEIAELLYRERISGAPVVDAEDRIIGIVTEADIISKVDREGLSVGELCAHLLDPARNGGRSGAAVVDHLSTNLVRWAWNAGVDRNGRPRRAPPLGYDDFVQRAKLWVSAGAKCPG